MRTLVISVFTCLAIYWLLFFIRRFFFSIVPADSGGGDNDQELARVAGWLFLLSLIGIWLPTGIFGRGRFLLGLSTAITFGWLAAAPGLFLQVLPADRLTYIAYLSGIAALAMGTVTTYRHAWRSQNERC